MAGLLLLPGWAAAAPSPLSPAAQQEYDLGTAAFDAKDWDVAIRHFDKAQEADQLNPKVLYNLGLSHANARHELAAIAWLEAYLVFVAVGVMPDNEFAADARKEITRLTAAAEGKIDKVTKGARAANDQLREDSPAKGLALDALAYVYLIAGEEDKALEATRGVRSNPAPLKTLDDKFWCDFAEYHTEWDPESACAGLLRVQEPAAADGEFWDGLWGKVCEGFCHQGDWDGLQKAAERIQDEKAKRHWLAKTERPWGPGRVFDPHEWVSLARELSKDDAIVDFDQVLEKSAHGGETAYIPSQMADVAWNLSKAVLRIRMLRALAGHCDLNDRSWEAFYGPDRDDPDALKALLQDKPELIRARDKTGATLLHRACDWHWDITPAQRKAIVELLIAQGADVDAVDDDGSTPLHCAAWPMYGGQPATVALVELLLARGANANATDDSGDTPLYIAAYVDEPDSVETLLKRHADPNIKDEDGMTALDRAVASHCDDVIDLLRKNGAKRGNAGE
jgi:ankyrin repeat protein